MLASSGAPIQARSGKRLNLRALGLAAVVALLLITGLGFVTAGNESPTDARTVPTTAASDDDPYAAFATVAPRMGDIMEYTTDGSHGHHEHVDGARIVRLQWIETQGVADTDGLGRPTVGLAQDRDGDGPEQTYLVDTDARRVYALESTSQVSETKESDGFLGIGTVKKDSGNDRYAAYYGRPFLDMLPCVSLHALQDRPDDLTGGVTLYPHGCVLPDGTGVPADAAFFPVANETLEGHDTIVLAYDSTADAVETPASEGHSGDDHGHGHDHGGQAVTVRIWMSPDLAYPLRLEVDATIQPETIVHRLTGIATGEGTLEDHAQRPDDLQDVPLSERAPWGPDEAGIDHPFPLSEAFEIVRLDPHGGATWSLEHPDAVVTSAWHHMMRFDHSEEHWWIMTLDDGEESIQAWASKRLQGPANGTQTPIYHSGTDEPVVSHFDPDRLPDRTPTVDGLLERHAASAPGPAEGVHTWSFDTWCGADGCTIHFTAGKKMWDTTGHIHPFSGVLPVEDRRSALWQSAITTDMTGRASMLYHMSYEATTTWSGQSVQEPAREPIRTQSVGQPLPTPTAIIWIPPDTGTVAGAGFVALLLGAAYRGLMQVGAFPLFSRIAKDKALDHPVRERIHSAVVATPGIHLRQAARRTDTKVGTVRYHVRKLVECGLLRRERHGGYVCLFPGEESRAIVLAAASATKSDGARRILAALETEDAPTITSLAEATGLTKQVVSRHVANMTRAGLVDKTTEGRTVRVRAIRPAASSP